MLADFYTAHRIVSDLQTDDAHDLVEAAFLSLYQLTAARL